MIKRVEVKGTVVTIESDYGIFTKDLEEKIIQVEFSGRRDRITVNLDKRSKNGIKGCDIDEKGEIILEWRPKESDIYTDSFEDELSTVTKVEIKGKENFIIESGKGNFMLKFNSRIDEFLIFCKKILIVTDYYKNVENNRNIYCLNEKAEILWQIQDPDTYRPGLPQSDSPFTGISISEDGKLKAWNWDSHVYDVDIETGRLLYAKWTK